MLPKKHLPYVISIPLWYDYKQLIWCQQQECFHISIPLWYDYKNWFDANNRSAVSSIGNTFKNIFQFLYGTIISVTISDKWEVVLIFQFLYGTIISAAGGGGGGGITISIPLWYDYKPSTRFSCPAVVTYFNSSMVRL